MGLEERFAGPMSRASGVGKKTIATRTLGARKALDYRPFNLVFGLVDVGRLHLPGHSCRQHHKQSSKRFHSQTASPSPNEPQNLFEFEGLHCLAHWNKKYKTLELLRLAWNNSARLDMT